jgi:hypothetical protein
MRWTEAGAHLLLQIRTQVLNGDWRSPLSRWYVGMRATPVRPGLIGWYLRCSLSYRDVEELLQELRVDGNILRGVGLTRQDVPVRLVGITESIAHRHRHVTAEQLAAARPADAGAALVID